MEKAKMKVQNSIEIAAPPEKVWPFLVEPGKIMKWCITFRKFESFFLSHLNSSCYPIIRCFVLYQVWIFYSICTLFSQEKDSGLGSIQALAVDDS